MVDEIFIDDVRVFLSIMNGKTHLLVKNPRYSTGYDDITQYVNSDETCAEEIARNLRMNILKQCRDIDHDQFIEVFKELSKLIKKNSKAGLKTFVYLQYGGHGE